MADISGIFVAKGEAPVNLLPRFCNRHGLIAGATGTGKTVTLQVIAEGLSARGVPVFMADVKGDLAGLSQAGEAKPKIQERLTTLGIADHQFRAYPAIFWDLFGEQGHPVRATISDVGPLLLGRLLDLNEVQTGVLNLAFKVADDRGTAAAGSQGPAGAAEPCRRQRQGTDDDLRQCQRADSRRNSAWPACSSRARAARSSSASRRWISTT